MPDLYIFAWFGIANNYSIRILVKNKYTKLCKSKRSARVHRLVYPKRVIFTLPVPLFGKKEGISHEKCVGWQPCYTRIVCSSFVHVFIFALSTTVSFYCSIVLTLALHVNQCMVKGLSQAPQPSKKKRTYQHFFHFWYYYTKKMCWIKWYI